MSLLAIWLCQAGCFRVTSISQALGLPIQLLQVEYCHDVQVFQRALLTITTSLLKRLAMQQRNSFFEQPFHSFDLTNNVLKGQAHAREALLWQVVARE